MSPIKSNRLLKEDLKKCFIPKMRCSNAPLRVGIELEKIALNRHTLEPIPITGELSIQSLMRCLDNQFDWSSIKHNDLIIGLKRGDELISLEPGGQVELSCPESESIEELYAQEQNHLRELNAACPEHSVLWSGLGLQPLSGIDGVQWLGKERYKYMRQYFSNRSVLGHWMMKMTSSIQISIDFKDDRDAAIKTVVASKWSPIMTAAYANSCFSEGRINGFKSYRSWIWQNTDPDRCGLPKCYFEDDFSIDKYIEYALQAPLIFIQNGDTIHFNPGYSFNQFMTLGFEGFYPTEEDWKTHLSLLFPDVRLKSFVEIRAFDRQGSKQTFHIPLLMKLCFYSKQALNQMRETCRTWTHGDCEAAALQAAKYGLDGKLSGVSLRDWFAELLNCAETGLKELSLNQEVDAYEINLFKEIKESFKNNPNCPADDMLNAHKNGKSIQDLIRESEIVLEG